MNPTIPTPSDEELARCHAPRLRLDANEPFLPSLVGYTVFRQSADSPSLPRTVVLPPGAAYAIEYAIWWDWNSLHIADAQDVWLYLDVEGRLIQIDIDGNLSRRDALLVEDRRVTLYAGAGVHTLTPSAERLSENTEVTRQNCLAARAGHAGIVDSPWLPMLTANRNPLAKRAVHSYLECRAFEPAFDYTQVVDLQDLNFMLWAALAEYIPGRVDELIDEAQRAIPPSRQHLYKIAHRGASAYAPENSLEAFVKAAEMESDLVEVDIRVTADGVPVISHDPSLKRVFGVEGVVADRTFDELLALTPPGTSPIPTFDAVAKLCAELGLGLYLDIKEFSFDLAGRMIASLKRYGLLDQCIAGSFSLDTVADLKLIEPRLMTSILFGAVNLDPVGLAQAIHADYVHPCWERRAPQPHTLLTPEWIARVHGAGLGIVCWHEERPEEIAALRALGVEAICSDTPDRLALHRTGCA